MALTDYSEQTIAEVIIIGGMVFCALSVLKTSVTMNRMIIIASDIDFLFNNILVSELL